MLIEKMIFRPTRRLEQRPDALGLRHEEVCLPVPGGPILHGWYFPGMARVKILWLHGNSGNMSHRLDLARLLLDRVGANLFLFDYRGYGMSEGKPTEQGIYADAEAAAAWLRSKGDAGEPLYYFGQSLGSAVAIELERRHRPHGVIIESAFTSVRERSAEAVTGKLFAPMFGETFDSLKKIGGLRSPLLVIHGEGDGVVNAKHAHRLFGRAPEPKRLYLVRGADHGDCYAAGGDAYFAAIKSFIESTLPAATPAGKERP
ncbi:MAG: alpha/beta hydrolase [Chloroflexi bacterium]|nr:alpha/beta hydrolase [Chloroflexota bacterium]